MQWLQDKNQVEVRADGTYVVQALINGEWMPYHTTQDYSPELYDEVKSFMEGI